MLANGCQNAFDDLHKILKFFAYIGIVRKIEENLT